MWFYGEKRCIQFSTDDLPVSPVHFTATVRYYLNITFPYRYMEKGSIFHCQHGYLALRFKIFTNGEELKVSDFEIYPLISKYIKKRILEEARNWGKSQFKILIIMHVTSPLQHFLCNDNMLLLWFKYSKADIHKSFKSRTVVVNFITFHQN